MQNVQSLKMFNCYRIIQIPLIEVILSFNSKGCTKNKENKGDFNSSLVIINLLEYMHLKPKFYLKLILDGVLDFIF